MRGQTGLTMEDKKRLFDLDEEDNSRDSVTRIRPTEESLTIAQLD